MISIVDDDEPLRFALEGLVRSAGYGARTFASAEDFLASSGLTDTCCLVTDIQMSSMNGVDLHRTLTGQGHNIPVIFITAFPTQALRRQAAAPGVIALLCKPFDIDLILDKIGQAIRDAGCRAAQNS